MRFAVASVALFAVSVAAQNIPQCAMGCVASPSTLGGCTQNDMKCLCSSKEFIQATTACLQTACPADQLEAARGVAVTLCKAAGVTLDLPTASGSASSASNTSPASSTTSAAPATRTSNAAVANGANAIAGLAAIGMAALAL